MVARRTVTAFVVTAFVVLGVTGLSTPAQAEELLNCTKPGNTVELSGSGPFDFENEPGYTCQEVRVTNSTVALTYITVERDSNGDGTFDQDASALARAGYEQAGTGVRITYSGPSTSSQIIVEFVKFPNTANEQTQTYEITLGSGGGGGGDSGDGDSGGGDSGSSGSSAGSGSSSTAPTVLLQALDLFGDDALPADENELVGWEKTVPVNTWQALPQSQDVVGIGANEGKVFLGMATTPDFPVDIAQRQVENGWGAYEMHGDDGEVESVFIPAGGSMFVWTQPRLYAVWGTA